MNYSKEIKVVAHYDVIVCGGGSAGFCAAIAAARTGVKTAIIEKNGMLGGVATVGRNNEIALFNAGPMPIIRGIGWEFVTRLSEMGYASIPEFSWEVPHSSQGVLINIPMAAHLMDVFCDEEEVKLYYHTTLVDVVRQDNAWLCICASKSGLWAIEAEWVVDCSGDGDACAFAGAQYEIGGEQDELQPGTLGFYLDFDEKYVVNYQAIESQYRLSIANGELRAGDIWSRESTPAQLFSNRGNNVGHVNIDTEYAYKHSDIEKKGRASVMRLQKWFDKYFPEAGLKVHAVAPEVSFRESRRICCLHRMTANEYSLGVTHDDDICYSYYPIDLHIHDEHDNKTLHIVFADPKNGIPGISYRSLVPKNVPNMLVAGRCIGGERLAQSAYRVKASCMATGQAAGTAAALIVRNGVHDVNLLREALHKSGAIIPNYI